MAKDKAKIDGVCKVTVGLRAGADRDAAGKAAPEEISFIYGIGTGGLTGLEYGLAGKAPGDVLELSLKADQVWEELGHLPIDTYGWFKDAPEVFLALAVRAVETPEPREIVKAMARAQAAGEAGCGGGCGCGCGCGG